METINPRSLSESVTHRLMDAIKTGKYSTASRLPAEDELSREFGVSRSMMRECLTEIERTGIITRHKGIGTMINRRIVNIPSRLDLITGLDSILVDLGYTPSTSFLEITEGIANEEVAENLDIGIGSPVYIVKRVVATNGTPSLFLTDYIPMNLLPRKKYTSEEMIPSIFQFLREEANIETSMFLTEIRAVPLPEEAAEHFNMSEGSPVLLLCETGFDYKNTPVMYTREYLVDQVIHQIIVRKKI